MSNFYFKSLYVNYICQLNTLHHIRFVYIQIVHFLMFLYFLPMLSNAEHEILLKACSIVMKNPKELTRKQFNIVYNTVYTHCSSKSENYTIKGEDIYNFLDNFLDQFCRKVEFTGSCDSLAEQIQIFQHSVDILAKLFSYLERFYIKTSILNCADVKKIRDLFYHKIYYSFIYKIEEGLLNLISLEVETLRNFNKHDVRNLKIVVQFYLESLARNGLETSMNQFYKRYINEFKSYFNFNCSIKQLVKKIHMEIYITTNVFKDYEVTKEIIQSIEGRKDEIIDYAFIKILNFEKLKHIYTIISRMTDSSRMEFKQRYESFMKDQFTSTDEFEELYHNYCNVIRQIRMNKMNGFIDLVDECINKSFKERSSNNQMKIYDGIVEYIDKEFCKEIQEQNDEMKTTEDKEVFFDFFASIADDRLIDKYITSVQFRLINGQSAINEQILSNFILKRLGLGVVSRLSNSISSFLNKNNFKYEVNSNDFLVSLVKLTKGFWIVEKSEIELHPVLNSIQNEVYQNSGLEEKQKLEFNYTISPIIFILNGTKYKISSDVFSIYYYILNSDKEISYDDLKSKCNDKNFDKNIQCLLNGGLVGCVNTNENQSFYIALDKHNEETFVDMFNNQSTVISNKEIQEFKENKAHIVEAQICRMMKQKKFIAMNLIYNELSIDPIEVENAITNLVAKEYLEIINGCIHYLP